MFNCVKISLDKSCEPAEVNGLFTAGGSGEGYKIAQEGNAQGRAWAKGQVLRESRFSSSYIPGPFSIFPRAFVLIVPLLPMAIWVSGVRTAANFFSCSNKLYSLLT